MLASSIWFIFGLSTISSLPSTEQFELIGRIGVYHGIGVVSIVLLVPTLLAGYGFTFFRRWFTKYAGSKLRHPLACHRIDSPLFTNCSTKLPIRTCQRINDQAAISTSLYALWAEWGEALFMTGAFLCCTPCNLLRFRTPFMGKSGCGLSVLCVNDRLSQ